MMIEELLVDVNNLCISVSADAPRDLIKKWRGRSPAGMIRHLQSTEYYDTVRIVASTPATALFTSYDILCTAASFSTENRYWSITKNPTCQSSTCEDSPTPTSDCALHVNHIQFTTGQTYVEPKIC